MLGYIRSLDYLVAIPIIENSCILPGAYAPGGAFGREQIRRGRERGRETQQRKESPGRCCQHRGSPPPTSSSPCSPLPRSSSPESEQRFGSPLPTSSSPCSDLHHRITSSSSDAGKWSNAPPPRSGSAVWFVELRASFHRTTTIFGIRGLRSTVLHRSDNQPMPDHFPRAALAARSDGSICAWEYRRLFVPIYLASYLILFTSCCLFCQ